MLEKQAEPLCLSIKQTLAENWEIRNKSVLGLLTLITQYENASPTTIQEAFSANFFRMLKEPLKDLVSDLRSIQIRDTCLFLVKLAEVTKDNINMKAMLREVFSFILDGIKVPNRVMSGYVDTAIISMIKHTTFKTCLPSLITEIKNSKAKLVREHCLEYLNEILIHWEINEKDADMITDAIKLGLEDPAVHAREIARMAYLNMHLLFPKKTDKIKATAPLALQQRLLKAEQEHISPILKKVRATTTSTEMLTDVTSHVDSGVANHAMQSTIGTITSPTGNKYEDKDGRTSPRDASRSHTHQLHNNNNNNNNNNNSSIDDGNGNTNSRVLSPVKIANLRARRQSYEESAVQSIQAVIRGNLCRRMSMRLVEGGQSSLTMSDRHHPDHNKNNNHGSNNNSPISNNHSPTHRVKDSPEESLKSSPISSSNSTHIYTSRPPTPPTKTPSKSSPLTVPSTNSPSHVVTNVAPFATSNHSHMSNHHNQQHLVPLSSSSSSSSAASNTPIVSTSRVIRTPPPSALPAAGIILSPAIIPSSSSLEASSPMTLTSLTTSDNTYPTDLAIGQTVQIKGKDTLTQGEIRFIGVTAFASGYWVGVELSSGVGKNDGTVLGQRYFACAPLQGLFVRACQVDLINSHATEDQEVAVESGVSEPSTEQRILGLLKIKVASAMESLHRQLEIIENLENNSHSNSSGSGKNTTIVNNNDNIELIRTLQTYVEEEFEINREFSARLSTLL